MKILVTGTAGFIGFSMSLRLLKKKYSVVGIDNLDKYYNIRLKKKRLNLLTKFKNFKFIKLDLSKAKQHSKLSNYKFDYIFHFAAQPGVRYSLLYPERYYENNVKAYNYLIENINKKNIKKIIYASSSSVYGDQKSFPTNEKAYLNAKNPYAISKVINEKISEMYSSIYNINFIGLRFFTAYGEWGRPDMFIIKLLNSIYKKKVFYLNNKGNHYRDFTYIGDIVSTCEKLLYYKSNSKNEIFNICAGQKVNIKILLYQIVKQFPKAKIKMIKANKADVYQTFGSNKKIVKSLKLKKFINIKKGLEKTITWYKKNKIYKYF